MSSAIERGFQYAQCGHALVPVRFRPPLPSFAFTLCRFSHGSTSNRSVLMCAVFLVPLAGVDVLRAVVSLSEGLLLLNRRETGARARSAENRCSHSSLSRLRPSQTRNCSCKRPDAPSSLLGSCCVAPSARPSALRVALPESHSLSGVFTMAQDDPR